MLSLHIYLSIIMFFQSIGAVKYAVATVTAKELQERASNLIVTLFCVGFVIWGITLF